MPDPEDDELANADARELLRFEIGADLFMRDRASISAAEVNLTSQQVARNRDRQMQTPDRHRYGALG